jgi:hypothetical protein
MENILEHVGLFLGKRQWRGGEILEVKGIPKEPKS